MAYKKYIRRGGKVYGPYLYHSRRVDGKVVSEYHGSKKLDYGKFFLIFLGVFLLVTFFYVIGSSERKITGNAVIDLNADYEQGLPLEGKINLFLDEGEMLSPISKIVFENNGNSFEYNLTDFMGEGVVNGEIFPIVYFKLSILSQKQAEINETEENVTEGNEVTEESQAAPITGSAISNFFGKLTGDVVVEFETEVEGQVSATENFTYTLKEGERAELKPRSAKTLLKQLPDSVVEIITEGNQVLVMTDYSEAEEGSNEIIIELSELGLVFEEGNLNVSIIDNGEIISSVTTVLGEESILEEIEEPIIEPPVTNNKKDEDVSEVIEDMNETETLIPHEILELTVEERAVLLEEFGSTSVEITEASSKNGFITIRYEIGDFWVENSYSEFLSNETLEKFMEDDRVKWLKDVVRKLLEETREEIQLDGFLGNESV